MSFRFPGIPSAYTLTLLAALTACSSGSTPTTLPTSRSTTNPITVPLSNSSGQLAFPTESGSTAAASYTLLAAPVSGTSLTLGTQVGSTGLPAPLGTNASILVAFAVTTNTQFQLSQFPAWQVTPPTGTTLTGPYGVEVFDGTAFTAAYTASIVNGAISAPAFGAPFSVQPGHTYVFEIVNNAMIGQLPR